MTARFRLPAGRSYNVRASELARDSQHTEVVCNILLLDNTVQAFKVNKHDQGQVLLDVVFKHLELTERDYFGLHLADDSSDSPVGAKRWLDPNKPIRKQLKRGSPHNLSFRVKFFVTDPNKLQEEYTRYQYFLQLKQDILTGRLPCPHNTAALLASYSVQSELGDYSDSEHAPGYLSEFCFIPNPPQGFDKEVTKHHQQHSGLSPAQSEFNYLNTARTLELYGVELHYARDQSNTDILIGVMSAGIMVYKNRVRINCFPWLKIVKISFKCKQFFVQLRREVNETRETLLGFNMVNYRACKNLWKTCVEHHTFFRLDRPVPPQKNFFTHYFSLGSKFRYCGRTEVQSVQYGKEKGIKDRVFARSPSKPLSRKLMGGTDWEVVSKNSLSDERLETQSLPTRSPPGTPNHRNSFVQEGTRMRPSSVGHLVDHVIHASPSLPVFANHKSASSTQANSISLDSTPSPETVDGQPPALPPKQSRKNLSQIIQAHSQQSLLDNHINEMYDVPMATDKTTLNGVVSHDNLVLLKMRPDDSGRFGFNVKGGADQKMPVIVSRVAPGTSADLCVPRLNEGDQVVLINGRDISEHTHDQVVMFIKASCESHSGELILLVRPNAIYDVVEEKQETEPDFQYIPEKSPQDPSQLDQDAWRDSINTLKEGLVSGGVLAQFDQLYRKRPGMTMLCAKLPQNISKNRYRDISPYDATRVILKSTDDYINANYINMEIPVSSLINRYIACQGPLPNTCPDFWQMTWEQGSSVVVMLTTQVERGRVKCHQYWPNPDSAATYGHFQVACLTEEGNSAFLVRDMTLTHLESDEVRELTQIQYVAWPDHGVPDDSSDFLDFVSLVRSKRTGKDEPMVVHCSAGIGRTGVLITMETALCLMECSQPVYPLDIVRTMRDQRAMMIQTPSQYKFVCEAILRVYEEGLVKPLKSTLYQREEEVEVENGGEEEEDEDVSISISASVTSETSVTSDCPEP
ncbi:tyrosine-protein phosphatase non-receptor type 4-like isoform X1 [Coregonus clupeaformis]|uniref:tyrosine-protein phosphatase non-receptor type 4-like isoform X1 n=1 Tax=Coregonus clupeaformis TaxID=59861 RepID=UPI001E1C5ACD|nr:tyrosine-protein phosphatase non-receptor type 4-like isoform X1 [Coregonus clupeaformis]XP_041700069.2 tyrosine-protein phosphatase non-receptor type 4-like isoform X1 [Coregonus clupeaformis]